jgi:hypothetical protein
MKIIVYTLRRILDSRFHPRELASIPALTPGMGANFR